MQIRRTIPIALLVPAMRFDIASVEGPGDTTVPVVAWGELDEQVRSESRSKVDEARDWIIEVLGDGPVLGSTVRAAAKDRGISERTLAKAKKVLLIRSEPPAGPTAKWMPPDHLCIPARPKGNGRDAQMAVEEVHHG